MKMSRQTYENVQTNVLDCEKGNNRRMKQDSSFSEPDIINTNETALSINTKIDTRSGTVHLHSRPSHDVHRTESPRSADQTHNTNNRN